MVLPFRRKRGHDAAFRFTADKKIDMSQNSDQTAGASASPRVITLCRYPVKGLSAETLPSVKLTAGEAVPFDRAYAIENGAGRFDPARPKFLPKINFLMLMRHERLAALQTSFDEASHALTILRDGKRVARGALNTWIGRQMIEQFFAAYMKSELKGPPRIVSADGFHFGNIPQKALHLVNLATVRDLSRIVGMPLDPLRFRANVYFDGLAPWRELQWVGRTLQAGAVRLSVFEATNRCDAVNVNPITAQRDTAILPTLKRVFGHVDLGVYAQVATGGTLSSGDAIAICE
jgi:uncharacterized protein YcbX